MNYIIAYITENKVAMYSRNKIISSVLIYVQRVMAVIIRAFLERKNSCKTDFSTISANYLSVLLLY